MGYTHYYYQKPSLNRTMFFKVSLDMKKMLKPLEHLGVKLGDAFGENYPYFESDEIRFNGYAKCGHEQRDMGITWPKPGATGISQNKVGTQLAELTSSHWFGGAELETRVCGGNCSHETFSLESRCEDSPDKETGFVFNCTKTAYKPYDLAVNVCLIIAKHYLKDDIIVYSDGDDSNWIEGKQLCQHFLGYGEDFKLDSRQVLEDVKKENRKKAYEKITEQAEKIDMSSVSVGDIFVRSWGYDQTNVDYCKVVYVSKTGKSAKLQRIASKSVESLTDMSDQVMPDPDTELKDYKVILGRIRKYNDLSSLYCGNYHKWDGKPDFRSSWA